MFHSIGTALEEDLFELKKQSVPLIIILIVNQMKHLGNSILTLFKLVWVLLGSSILLVLQQRHYEFYQLVNGLRQAQVLIVFDYRFHDFERDSSLVLELHILHQGWVVIH